MLSLFLFRTQVLPQTSCFYLTDVILDDQSTSANVLIPSVVRTGGAALATIITYYVITVIIIVFILHPCLRIPAGACQTQK